MKQHKHEKQPEAAETTAAPQEAKPDQSKELIEQLQRLQAEFENYRKRAQQEIADSQDKGKEAAIKELLPVADSMELALKHQGSEHTELRKGIELMYSQLLSSLERLGVKIIPKEGAVNPRLHEVYLTEHSEKHEDNTIIETLQQGYQRNGSVLRTAKVKAARRTP